MNLRKLAMGQDCLVRVPGYCNFNPETTSLAHIRRANVAGTGQKPPDTCAVWACSCCHDVIDFRIQTPFSVFEIDSMLLAALVRQLAWYDKHEILITVRAA